MGELLCGSSILVPQTPLNRLRPTFCPKASTECSILTLESLNEAQITNLNYFFDEISHFSSKSQFIAVFASPQSYVHHATQHIHSTRTQGPVKDVFEEQQVHRSPPTSTEFVAAPS